jgi:hypothetical protein
MVSIVARLRIRPHGTVWKHILARQCVALNRAFGRETAPFRIGPADGGAADGVTETPRFA